MDFDGEDKPSRNDFVTVLIEDQILNELQIANGKK